MKQRLPHIALALVGLFLTGTALAGAVFENSLDIFKLVFGFACLLYGGYKTAHPDKND